MATKAASVSDTLPNYVHDIATASCVFCPYGADAQAGDRLYIYDEKTVYGRQQRERLVEVTAIKQFRSTGRVITLDLAMIGSDEASHIAQDSETSVEALLEHRPGNATYDAKRPPVVVYFEPVSEDDTTGSRTRPGQAVGLASKPQNQHDSRFGRLLSKLTPWRH
ncbi:MAG TPA: hypothetical protein VKT74_09550 [Gammaproteobacteria bacterium]|nr:hypothetical protein [Gammaproteobacteria bacterium]